MRLRGLIPKQINKINCWCFFLLFLVSMSSCVSSRNTTYFQTLKKDTTLQNFVTNDFENKIVAGDVLGIKASSLNAVEDAFFNQGGSETSGTVGTSAVGTLVKDDGSVTLQRLGNITAAGLTRKELAAAIQKGLLPYMKEPLVTVSFLNHKVTVLGAVGKPQVLSIQTEQVSLIDALVSSGDIAATGMKQDVMIIREEGNKKTVKHVNLEDASIFSSPWYYLRPNDIVYVMNDKAAADKAERKSSLRSTLSLIASGVGLLIIIIDRVFK